MNSPSSKNSVTLSTAITGAVNERLMQFEILRLTMKILTDLSRNLLEDRIIRARRKFPISPTVTITDIEITLTKNKKRAKNELHIKAQLDEKLGNT